MYHCAESEDSDAEGGLGNVNKMIIRPPGHSGKAKKGHICFDASFETGNLGRVDLISEFEYDLFIRPDTCNPRLRMWFNFTVDNVKADQRVIFNIVNISKSANLFRNGMTPLVKSSSRSKWQRIPRDQVSHREQKEEICIYISKIYSSKIFILGFLLQIGATSKPLHPQFRLFFRSWGGRVSIRFDVSLLVQPLFGTSGQSLHQVNVYEERNYSHVDTKEEDRVGDDNFESGRRSRSFEKGGGCPRKGISRRITLFVRLPRSNGLSGQFPPHRPSVEELHRFQDSANVKSWWCISW